MNAPRDLLVAVGAARVLPICLGGNVFGWTADPAASHLVLDAFVAGGGSFLDTADVYSAWVPGHVGGESESIIGAWLAARGPDVRDRVLLATKVAKHPRRPGLAPATIRAALDESRRRLGVERVDLYYAHHDDASVPLADVLGTFSALVDEGAVAAYGLSNYTPARVGEALELAAREGYAAPVALQPHYSLVHRAEVEAGGLADLAVTHDLAIAPYYALASGFLTGKYRRGEPVAGARGPRVAAYLTEPGFALLDELTAVAGEAGATPAAVALAWLRARRGVAAPIASATGPEQVAHLLAGARLVLDPAHTERLTRASQPFT